MTKQEAEAYIKLHAGKEGLTWEVMQTFDMFCKTNEDSGFVVDYECEAHCALMEWDI